MVNSPVPSLVATQAPRTAPLACAMCRAAPNAAILAARRARAHRTAPGAGHSFCQGVESFLPRAGRGAARRARPRPSPLEAPRRCWHLPALTRNRARGPASCRALDDPRATSGQVPVRSTNPALAESWRGQPHPGLTLPNFLVPVLISHRPWLSHRQMRPSFCS